MFSRLMEDILIPSRFAVKALQRNMAVRIRRNLRKPELRPFQAVRVQGWWWWGGRRLTFWGLRSVTCDKGLCEN